MECTIKTTFNRKPRPLKCLQPHDTSPQHQALFLIKKDKKLKTKRAYKNCEPIKNYNPLSQAYNRLKKPAHKKEIPFCKAGLRDCLQQSVWMALRTINALYREAQLKQTNLPLKSSAKIEMFALLAPLESGAASKITRYEAAAND